MLRSGLLTTPLKKHQTPLHNRFHMLELLIGELTAPPGMVQVHPELSHMRTIVCIERAQQKWPEAEFFPGDWIGPGAANSYLVPGRRYFLPR